MDRIVPVVRPSRAEPQPEPPSSVAPGAPGPEGQRLPWALLALWVSGGCGWAAVGAALGRCDPRLDLLSRWIAACADHPWRTSTGMLLLLGGLRGGRPWGGSPAGSAEDARLPPAPWPAHER